MAGTQKNQKLKPIISGAVVSAAVILTFVLIIWGLFAVSMLDTDKTVSEKDNRVLKTRPKFSVSAVLDGSFTTDFDGYYSDTFPFRDEFLTVNSKIKKLFSQTRSSSSQDMVIVDFEGKDDFAGQDID